MKNRFITGGVFILLGLLIAFGPKTLFPVCGVGHAAQNMKEMMPQMTEASSAMKCFYTARAELGIGLLIAVFGLLLLLIRSVPVRLGLSLSLVFTGILSGLVPSVLIGVCSNVHMSCHMLTLPALSLLGTAVTALSVGNTIYLHKITAKGVEPYARETVDNPSDLNL